MATKEQITQVYYDEFGMKEEITHYKRKIDILDKKRWQRIVLKEFMTALGLAIKGEGQFSVAMFLFSNLNDNNEFKFSQQETADKLNLSRKTVNITINELIKVGLLKKYRGRYVVNNTILGVFGSKDKNTKLIVEYEFIKPQDNNIVVEEEKNELVELAKKKDEYIEIMKSMNDFQHTEAYQKFYSLYEETLREIEEKQLEVFKALQKTRN